MLGYLSNTIPGSTAQAVRDFLTRLPNSRSPVPDAINARNVKFTSAEVFRFRARCHPKSDKGTSPLILNTFYSPATLGFLLGNL